MAKQPLQSLISTELTKFGLPLQAQLRQPATVSATISDIIAKDEAVAVFHRKMVHFGICYRYGLALAVAAEKEAFAAYLRDPRIKALPRPPKGPSDALVSLFNATYGDPKKASKYFKRIEPLWLKRRPTKVVLAFLQKEGLSDPAPKVISVDPTSETKELKPSAEKTEAIRGGRRSQEPEQIIDKRDPPGGSISGWSINAKIGWTYKLTVKIHDTGDDWVSFALLEVPELLT